jgi:hypothetical protein
VARPDGGRFHSALRFDLRTAEEQQTEVVRLNKGAATGMKGAIRKQRINVQFKALVNEKMKAFIIANRTEQASMFRNVVQPRILHKLQLKFLSVGEWVEVDADRTLGGIPREALLLLLA